MRKLSIDEYAYIDPYATGIGERNTVSTGVDVDPNTHTNDCLASHFANCMRHGTTAQAIDNILGANGGGVNIGGHGDAGFLETGGGQAGPFPNDKCIYFYDEIDWGPQFDRLQGAPITTISIWSCHVGAEQDGADLLFEMAKRCQRTVRAGTGFLYCSQQDVHWQAGAVWQVATPIVKPAPIPRPPGQLMMTKDDVRIPTPNGSFSTRDIVSIHIVSPPREGAAPSALFEAEGHRAQSLAKKLFISRPLDVKAISIPAIVTGLIVVRSKDGEEVEFLIYNGGLAIDRKTDTGFYLSADPLTVAARS